MKKKISLLLFLVIFTLAASTLAHAAVSEFNDATKQTVNGTSYNAIYWAVDQGIVKGYSDNTFRPEDICTREQFSIMLWRFADQPASDANSANKFTDSSAFSSTTSKKAIGWAVEKGIVKGFSDGSFGPGEDITRAQVAVMLWRFAGEPSVSGSSKFSDIGTFSANVQKAIIWLEGNKIASGYKDGTFKPNDGCQRQHMAIFLYRYAINILGEDVSVPDVHKDTLSDDDFRRNMSAGLNARWGYSATVTKDIDSMTADEVQKFYSACVKAETDKLGDISDYSFNDPNLKMLAEDYFAGVTYQAQACKNKSPVHDNEAGNLWSRGYWYRVFATVEISIKYGLYTGNDYLEEYNNFAENYEYAKRYVPIYKFCDEIESKTIYVKADQDENYNYFEGTIENTSGYEIEYLELELNFIDSEGKIIYQDREYISEMKPGEKLLSKKQSPSDKGTAVKVQLRVIDFY